MRMTRTERADLDKCTALAKRIKAAERLSDRPADIVLSASTLLTFERTMAGRQDQARPSEVREVLELRLNDPEGWGSPRAVAAGGGDVRAGRSCPGADGRRRRLPGRKE